VLSSSSLQVISCALPDDVQDEQSVFCSGFFIPGMLYAAYLLNCLQAIIIKHP
jgi:hypothetical protein